MVEYIQFFLKTHNTFGSTIFLLALSEMSNKNGLIQTQIDDEF